MSRRRLRSKPVMVYLSTHELELLDQLAERRQCTRADVVRRWILSYATPRAKTTPNAEDDPRQLRVPGS